MATRPPSAARRARAAPCSTARCSCRGCGGAGYLGLRPGGDCPGAGSGARPRAGERLIEVNLLDQTGDLYGQVIFVQFVAQLRGDHTFASADELSKQIARDVEQARIILRRVQQGVQ